MGCLKLYHQNWQEGLEKSPSGIFSHIEEKNDSPIFCVDYSPFGLTFNSYKREFSKKNNFLFHNETEFIEELNWYHFKYRMHDPALGRFFNIDPLADDYSYNSPYAFAENKLGRGIELEGAELLQFPWLGLGLAASRPTPIVRPINSLARVNKHHVISRQFKANRTVQQGRKGGFKFEGQENKMNLEQYSKSTGEGRHGNHPKYNQEVGRRISEFEKATGGKATPEEAASFLRNTVKDLKNIIDGAPDTKVNDLFNIFAAMGIEFSVVESDQTSSQENRALTQEELKQNREKAKEDKENEPNRKAMDDCANDPDCT